MSLASGMAAHAAKRVEKLKRDLSIDALRARPLSARKTLSLELALLPGARIVEVRFADPVAGLLVPREDATAAEAARRAGEAARAGAVAVAVWVERNFHAGDYEHLEAARAECPDLPLIAREVVVDPWQIERCRAAGADGLELMPELLGPAFDATAAFVRELGMTPLVWPEDRGPREA